MEKRAISVESIGARLGVLMNYSTSSMIFLWDCDFKKRIDCWHYPRLSVPSAAIKQWVRIHWKISQRSHTAIASSSMSKVHDSSTLTDAFEWGEMFREIVISSFALNLSERKMLTFKRANVSISHDVPEFRIARFSCDDQMLLARWYLKVCDATARYCHAANLRR